MTRRLIFAAVAVCAAVLSVLALSRLTRTVNWVGHTDVEIRFVVTDAETGRALPRATVCIQAERGGFCQDEKAGEITLTTDERGEARHVSRGCMCFGSSGAIENTFAVRLPRWRVHATAAGYRASNPVDLYESDYGLTAIRGKGIAMVTIPVELAPDQLASDPADAAPDPSRLQRLKAMLDSPSRDDRVGAFRELIALVRPGMRKPDVDEWIGPGERLLVNWRDPRPGWSMYAYWLDLGEHRGHRRRELYYIVCPADGIERVEEVAGPARLSEAVRR